VKYISVYVVDKYSKHIENKETLWWSTFESSVENLLNFGVMFHKKWDRFVLKGLQNKQEQL
jgi:hypothetical protein